MKTALNPKIAGESLHVAIIMDGSGRWARLRGLARAAGHRAGVQPVRDVVEAAPGTGIRALTLYAFSGSNWGRPTEEVSGLMRLFEDFFRSEKERWRAQQTRLTVIGRRDRLSLPLRKEICEAEALTRGAGGLHLRIAIDYSAQDMILEAARRFHRAPVRTRGEFSRLLAQASHSQPGDFAVDFLIRTGGEQRLSDFLLWEIAYAELYFSPKLWPDFSTEDLKIAMEDFRRRERRFGHLPVPEANDTRMPEMATMGGR
ncbi:MAG TPA: polyprenyl diphosphate synthase [Terriglobia bacterium]|nr:polyprenyl diphosphate synthase [Terriglobia bacterium]